eukprot:SAG11_NODE_635_length_8040_cov_3.233472_1_plen_507_part_00
MGRAAPPCPLGGAGRTSERSAAAALGSLRRHQTLDEGMPAALAAAAAVDFSPLLPHLPVGGRLRYFVPAWRRLVDDPWCVSVVSSGYVPELAAMPPDRPPKPLRLPPQHVEPMREMITSMLAQEVIEPVGSPLTPFAPSPWAAPACTSIYQSYFLIRKKEGSFRGCMDQRYYNGYVIAARFRMETLMALRDLARPGDWLCKIDIRDAYLHVPLRPAYRPGFRFLGPSATSGCDSFQFRTLCFGLKSAPRCFTRLLRPLISRLRSGVYTEGRPVRCMILLDDIAILGPSPLRAALDAALIVGLLRELGFTPHPTKSDLRPREAAGEYLGAVVDLRPEVMSFRLPRSKRVDIRRCCEQLLASESELLSPRQLSRVLGKLVAAMLMVHGGMTHSRPLQRDLKEALRRAEGKWDLPSAPLSCESRQALAWWIHTVRAPTACRMSLRRHERCVDTDASPWGWGGYHGTLSTGGFWTVMERSQSQNWKELRAVDLTIRSFVNDLCGHWVESC